MARPIKPGLDYFPLDVDFFNDPKLEFVAIACGELGELVAIKLLCLIYKEEGYYIHWNEDRSALFSKKVGKNVSPTLVNDVINELLKRSFFNKEMYAHHGILTSNGLQKRYAKINKDARRKFKIKPEYNVMQEDEEEEKKITSEETPVIAAETPVIAEETPLFYRNKYTKETKEKETKQNNNKQHQSITGNNGALQSGVLELSKKNDTSLTEWQNIIPALPEDVNTKKEVLAEFIRSRRPAFVEPYATLWNIFAVENGLMQVMQLTPERQQKIRARSREPFFDFVQCLAQIKRSDFARGLTPVSTWKIDFDYIIRDTTNYVKILEGRFLSG